jgi:hypothetical protein
VPKRKIVPHFKRYLDTKPPHDVWRRERCECRRAKDHSRYKKKPRSK